MSADSPGLTPEIDLGDVNDSRAVVLGRVPANCRVLDLGPADGLVARRLQEMGCEVWGVGPDPHSVGLAPGVRERVIECDLEAVDIIEHVGDQKFDVILLLDVLEQLSNPAALLQALPKVLTDNGWGVISLSNVAHASVRLDLLEGRFGNSATGRSDPNQLHFFDRRGIDDLLEQAGWHMFDLARVMRALDTCELQLDRLDPELANQLVSDSEALTHQFVIAAAPLGSAVLAHPPVLPAAIAQAALLEAMSRIRELDEEVRQLNELRLPDLLDRLDEIREGVFERKAKLKDILVAIRES